MTHDTVLIESSGKVLTKTTVKDEQGAILRTILIKAPTLKVGDSIPESTLKDIEKLVNKQ